MQGRISPETDAFFLTGDPPACGSGGRLFGITQGLVGVIGGAMVGFTSDYEEGAEEQTAESATYMGAVVGGLTLGTAGVLYQYFIPVERNESFLVAGAATTGFIAGVTLVALTDAPPVGGSLLMFGVMEAGIVSVLALTYGSGDVSNGDAALVGMSALYALALTGLAQGIVSESSSQKVNFAPTLLAPTVGMAVGGLLAMALELGARDSEAPGPPHGRCEAGPSARAT
ncbi:hypothetical protein [Hyalangium sp.]|uniref:hypothetical protein n=1 Tax=Hyalangium sp. TaxID=2028555 RepID=UPI002D2A3BB6|nr:hypothetical protein [Hyalangium sp.]HYH96426.1 hypothetical protein [Hyalangium sp.]